MTVEKSPNVGPARHSRRARSSARPGSVNWRRGVRGEPAQALLRQAAKRSGLLSRSVLASLVVPVDQEIDPLTFFQRGSSIASDRLLFARPSDGFALAAVGAASTMFVRGPSRFAQAAALWQDRCADALAHPGTALGTGLVLVGGFSFDPERTRGDLWSGYPDGVLLVPRYLLTQTDSARWLTVNTLVRPETDLEAETNSILEACSALLLGRGSAVDVAAAAQPPDEGQSEADTLKRQLVVKDVVPAAQWKSIARSMTRQIKRDGLRKVVLARECRVYSDRPFDPIQVLRGLRDENPGCFIFAVTRADRTFLGATPERLVRLREGEVQVSCLAGSAARGSTEEQDRRLGEALLASAKDRVEHEIVVEAIRETLARLCSNVRSPEAPTLMKLPSVQHLYTPLLGRVADGGSILDLVEQLHPTPSVGGYPREAALELIREAEQLDRGWYAGPVGWLDERGEGEFAVALRSALVHGSAASLFAGCGIVADSDPEAEYAESRLKLKAVLSALQAVTP